MNQNILSILGKRSGKIIILSIIISVLLNGLINLTGDKLGIPLFLDSIFTVVTAALFGIIPGILTGLFTNLFQEVLRGFPLYLYPFAIVNMTTGLLVGILVKHGYFSTFFGVFLVIIFTAFVNSLLGAIIVTIVFGGITNEEVDYIVKVIIMTGQSVFSSAFIARIFINLVDKGIAVLLAYLIYFKVKQENVI
ncbi:MAG: hypothetical protein PF693_10755 [Spirochaetia bacterium]|nr:hypothetical protein [Spirochaetia bacterium]